MRHKLLPTIARQILPGQSQPCAIAHTLVASSRDAANKLRVPICSATSAIHSMIPSLQFAGDIDILCR